MTKKRLASTVLAAIALTMPAVAVAAPASADPDTDFYNELHIYGIYGEKDYNAWFVKPQLDKDASTEQTWQFLGAAYRTYCPEKVSLLQQVAGPPPAGDAPAIPPAGPPLAAEQ